MQERISLTPPERGGNTVSVVLKIALIVSLVGLIVSVPRLFKKKPPETVASPEAEAAASQPPELSPKTASARPTQAREPFWPRPAPVETVGSSSSSVTPAASNLWASGGAAPSSGFLMASRLPELRVGIEGVMARFEPPVFYRVPGKFGKDLSNSLAEIRAATNVLIQFDFQFKALFTSAARDRQDYVGEAKSANAQRRAEADAAIRKLNDLQALYLERKRAFLRESASLKPTLQDPLDVMERKLPLYQKATQNYEKDINELEAAIFTVRQQVQLTAESLRANDNNIAKAYELSQQDALGQLNGLSNRLQAKLAEVNADVREYNAKLGRYGSPLHSAP